MPGLNGLHALKEIRKMERADGIAEPDGVKIIITTALHDPSKMKDALDSHCTAYLPHFTPCMSATKMKKEIDR